MQKTFKDILKEFKKHAEETKSSQTVTGYMVDLKQLNKYLEYRKLEIDILDISTDILNNFIQYLKEEGRSSRTIYRKFCSIRTFFRWAYERNYIECDITEDVEVAVEEDRPIEVLTQDEIRELIAVADNLRDKALVRFMYETGLRPGELEHLEVTDINLQRQEAHLRATDRHVYIQEPTKHLLEEYLYLRKIKTLFLFPSNRGTALSTVRINVLLDELAEKAGITKRVNPYILRHSLGVHLFQQGFDADYVAQYLGLTDKRSVEIYKNLAFPPKSQFISKFRSI